MLEFLQVAAYPCFMEESFGKRLRRLRVGAGYAQKELGRVAGRSEPWVSNLETGKIKGQPPFAVIMRWAAMLAVTPEYLSQGIGEGPAVEPLTAVLDRIGAFPAGERPLELDQPVAAGQHGVGITERERGQRRRAGRPRRGHGDAPTG